MVKNRISSEIWCRQQSSWYIIIVSFSQCGQCKKFSNIYRTSLTCLLTIKRSGCNTSPKFEMAFKWPLFLYIEFLLSTLFDESSNSSIYCVAHLFYCGVFFCVWWFWSQADRWPSSVKYFQRFAGVFAYNCILIIHKLKHCFLSSEWKRQKIRQETNAELVTEVRSNWMKRETKET